MFKFFGKRKKLPMRSKRMDREDYLFMGAQAAILFFAIYLLTQFKLSFWFVGAFILAFFFVPMLISLYLIDQDVKLGRELGAKLVKDKLPGDLEDGVFIGKDFHRVQQYIISETASLETEKLHDKEAATIKYLYYIDGYDIVLDVVENRITNICAYKL